MENKSISTELEAWLAFLSFDDPKRILELIKWNPKFEAMYLDIYEVCLNMERVVEMYSKELAELDRNTVRYMIDEMQEEIDQTKEELSQTREDLTQTREELSQTKENLGQKEERIRQLELALEEEKKKNKA